jgi:hypothetical protein
MKNQKSTTQKNENTKKLLKFGCLPILAIFVIILIASAIWPTDHFQSDKTSAAYVASKQIIKTQLQFPEEADFALLPVLSEIQEGTDSIYRVVGDVTVKNAFGVKSKIQYMLRMKYTGGEPTNAQSWQVIDYSIPGVE